MLQPKEFVFVNLFEAPRPLEESELKELYESYYSRDSYSGEPPVFEEVFDKTLSSGFIEVYSGVRHADEGVEGFIKYGLSEAGESEYRAQYPANPDVAREETLRDYVEGEMPLDSPGMRRLAREVLDDEYGVENEYEIF